MVFGRVSVFQCQRTMLFLVGVIGYSLQLSHMVRIGSSASRVSRLQVLAQR